MTGLLSRKAREAVYSTCPLCVYDSMEDGLSLYWWKNKEKGKNSLMSWEYLFVIWLYRHKSMTE